MLLDAWLGLAVFGPITLLFIVLSVCVLGFVLFRPAFTWYREWKDGETEQAGLTAVMIVVISVSLAAAIVAVFVDTRPERHLVLDLGKSQRALIAELRKCTTVQFDDSCDNSKYVVTVTIILPEGPHLLVKAKSLVWSLENGPSRGYIEIRDADLRDLPLQAGPKLLMQHINALPGQRDFQEQQRINKISAWLIECCKSNTVYSETAGIELTRHFGLQFYKNVDRFAVAYVLNPQP